MLLNSLNVVPHGYLHELKPRDECNFVCNHLFRSSDLKSTSHYIYEHTFQFLLNERLTLDERFFCTFLLYQHHVNNDS